MNFLEQVFENGYATKDVELASGKIKVTLQNLSAKDQLKIEDSMSEITGSSAFVLNTYSLMLLSYTVKKYNKNSFNSIKDAKDFLENQPSFVLDKLTKEHSEFEKELGEAITGEEIEKTFFETSSMPKDLEQKSGELNLGKEEA